MPDPAQPRLRGKSAGIVAVLSEGGHVGMAVLVGRRRAVTCAHVVIDALGSETDRPGPEARVALAFPLVAGVPRLAATVVEWSPPGAGRPEDVALLALEEDAPEEAGVAVLVDVSGIDLDGDPLSVYGFAKGHVVGRYIDARLMGSAAGGWTQIDGVSLAGAAIAPGFSGAGVWDAVHRGVVGLVVARLVPQQAERIAFMIPTADLLQVGADLPFERRRLSRAFQRCWTILASALFVACVVHVGATQGSSALMRLSFGGDSEPLAAFWGMHVVGVLMPVVFGLLLAFARSFREHEWWRRVPAFGSLADIPQSSGRRLTAVLGLLFLVAWPLYAEGHLIRIFFNEGRVYIRPDIFGLSTAELLEAGWCCDIEGTQYCTHDDQARFFGLVKPEGEARGGYWDNAYHYGDRRRGGSETFYPILQPLVVIGLFLASVVLAVLAILAVLQPSRRDRT